MIEIPGYKILRQLGRGGMATVYLAMQESVQRDVALKVMSPALAGSARGQRATCASFCSPRSCRLHIPVRTSIAVRIRL